jgi:hypothetical protein
LTVVRLISRIRSTPMIRAMPAPVTPTRSRIDASTTIPTPGVLGVPMDAPTAVAANPTSCEIPR